MTRDMDNWNYISVGLNFNIGKKSIAPLWWMNPMDYTYSQLKTKSAKSPCDKDEDGDGISDCFDNCPNTPKSVNTDSHGCPFDTDGDGIPDFKDKQLITPTECQPTDADGVGVCPDPECCKKVVTVPMGCSQSIPNGNINFSMKSPKLESSSIATLNMLAASMRNSPNCKVVVLGNGSVSKSEQQLSWDRVNSIINYMVEKEGIDRERFIFRYGNSGDARSVEYRSANVDEEGPSNTPPPFPNLRTK
jgi:outer membrane protein OmpA-like peptidoglycan-associated protein